MPLHEDPDVARHLLVRAGEQLRGRDPGAALLSFRSALDHSLQACLEEEEMEARFGSARCLELLHRLPEAILELEAAAERAEQQGLHGALLHASSLLGALYLSEGRWEHALETALRTRHLSRSAGDRRNEVSSLGLIGQIHRRRGSLQESLDAAMDGLALSQEMGDVDEELAFLSDMALVSLQQGSPDQAKDLASRGLEQARRHGREAHVPVFLGQLCQAARAAGEPERARGLAGEGLDEARRLGNSKEQAVFLQDLAVLLEAEGRFPEAIERFQESLGILESLCHREGLVLGYRRLALLLCLADESVRGLAALAHALTLALPVSASLFHQTFCGVFQLVAVPWSRRLFRELQQGLSQVDAALVLVGDHVEVAEQETIASYREMVEVLSLMAESSGDGESEAATGARRLAAELDARDEHHRIAEYVDAGYRSLSVPNR